VSHTEYKFLTKFTFY